jgi:hypothetical protein
MDEQKLRALLGEEAASEPGLQHVVCQVGLAVCTTHFRIFPID